MILKIVGLFIVVFAGWEATTMLGLTGTPQIVGAIVGASIYVLMNK